MHAGRSGTNVQVDNAASVLSWVKWVASALPTQRVHYLGPPDEDFYCILYMPSMPRLSFFCRIAFNRSSVVFPSRCCRP